MNKKKGFTLIELLAVIIILGVLMLVAIPSVTSYINNSRKEAYIDTARNYIRGAGVLVNSGKLDIYDTETVYYIPSSCISVETGGQSPYGGDFDPAYIVVTYDNDTYKYYWISRDPQGMGVNKITRTDSLTSDSIVAGIKKESIQPNTSIGSRNNIKLLSAEDCETFEDKPRASRSINVYVTWDVPDPVIGDTAHFHAQLNGYDNLVYTCQWQWSTDRSNWHDIEGATSTEMDVVVNRENNTWYWRILVDVED